MIVRADPRSDKVGTGTAGRSGYIMQNPTDSRNERASSSVAPAAHQGATSRPRLLEFSVSHYSD